MLSLTFYASMGAPHLEAVLSNHPDCSQEDSCQRGKVHETHAGRCGCLGSPQHGGKHHRPHCKADRRLRCKDMCLMMMGASSAQPIVLVKSNAMEDMEIRQRLTLIQ